MNEIIEKIVAKEFQEIPLKITHMKKGICNEVYLVELANRKVIIRLNENASEMSGSAKHIKLFKSLNIKVQEILASDYSKTFVPFAYQIRSFLEGKDIDFVIADLSEEELKGIAQEIAGIVEKLRNQKTNGKYGWVGENENNLKNSWLEIFEEGLKEIQERDKKTGVLGATHLAIAEKWLEKHRTYLKNAPSVFYYDDMSSKNVLIHNGEFAGLIDLDTIAYGDPLEGIGRIEASWYNTSYGKIYTNAVIESLGLNQEDREMVRAYALWNRISWHSENGIQFNQNTSSKVDLKRAEKDRKIIDFLILDSNFTLA